MTSEQRLYSLRMRWLEALRALRRAYASAPRAVRTHVVGRFLTCPMLAVVDRLHGGRLLDLGAGHGAFSVLALANGAVASAVALEPDLRKPLDVAATLRGVGGLARVASYADALVGRFDAVSILDVLYRLPFARWDEILGASHARLVRGGVLLLKEIDPTVRWKAAWNRGQEKVADLLGLTLGDAFSYETPAQLVERLRRLGFSSVEVVPLGRGYPHAHILYVARRA
jgi:cyclopropane fatty-acyl-phospholipid synthase-like methyltransferase